MAPTASKSPAIFDRAGRRPAGLITALLILPALLIWLAALLEVCLFLPAHGRVLSLLGLKLPALADDAFTLAGRASENRTAVLVGAALGLPALALVTWWVRHRQSSHSLALAWCIVLLEI